MEFSYEGIGQEVVTFAVEGSLEPGMVVTMTDNFTVGKGVDGSSPCGVVLSVEEDCCAVQVGGFVKVPFVGEALAVGMDFTAVDGNGCIQRYGSAGRKCLVIHVDEDSNTAIIKL